MKKLITILIILIIFIGCSDSKTIDGITYQPYGLLNKEEKRDPNIEYNLVFGNLVWGVILIETIIAPIYFFGFDIFEPVGIKHRHHPRPEAKPYYKYEG